MKNRIIISDEAESVFKEIIENENTPNYWKNRFENLSNRDDMILRGCFKELRESGLIHVQWADNYPYFIQILKDGYLYEEKKEQEERLGMSQFEKELYDLLKRADSILREYENNKVKCKEEKVQLSFSFEEEEEKSDELKDKILSLNPLEMTPIEALNYLYELQMNLKK